MKQFDKQLKYSIRKVSVGAASVVIGAFYFAMGAGVVHAETNATTEGGTSHSSPSPESNTNNPNSLPGSNYQAEPAPNPDTLLDGVAHSVKEETETKTVTRTIKYVDASDESKEVATPVIQTVTLTRKKGTEEWSTEKWEAKTAPLVDGYDVSGNNTVEAKEVTSSTKDETVLVYYSKKESASSNSSSTSETTTTRSRRVRREVGDNTDGGTDETSTGTTVNKKETVVDPKRKGETVQENHPGVNVPKEGEEGADDPNAHLTFKKPGEEVTVEEMWKIIQNMPDDFQNNERSYLRNMDTLGEALRFDKTAENPDGVPLKPGEIREISSFGGWTAIMKKDGETGKFAIGMKNEQGYFTGWYNKNGERQEGGMLGSDALDQIYVHEQALDRRFKYMLMLAKGRTIANKTDKAQDDTPFNIETANKIGNNLNNLPVKEKDDILQHSPNIEGFNGIEKTFKAFSTEYGSRLKIDFVTGYISDFEGSKGTYRIVVKAIKKDKKEETVYDHTINRIDGVVENEERYSQGVDLSAVNKVIKDLLKLEYDKKVNKLVNEKYKEKYPTERKKDPNKVNALKEEVRQEFAKKGETTVELPIDKEKLEGTGKLKNNFKEELNFTEPYATVANKLNNELKKMKDEEVKKTSPIWMNGGDPKAKDPDRVYKLLNFVLPTAKKIIYHADTDQLELQTDPEKVKSHREGLTARLKTKEASLAGSTDEEEKTKLKKEISALESAIRSTNSYTYLEARNGSKQAKILGSHMEATSKPDTSTLSNSEYEKYRTNKLAAGEKDGLAKFTGYFVEKNNVTRTDVLADDKLSEKITAEIGGDQDKLGKGGYFSTGDIPLGKDVVSYKVQVFAENQKRVGVNKQSPRLQYNLPILADFSVIQDTVAPSKEVTKRIVTKLIEKGKITEEEGKKITEEIEKKKKTSELRSLLSANVKVKYVDKQGNPLSIKDDSKFGKKDSDNTYIAAKDVLLTSKYDVTSSKRTIIEGTNDKYYKLVAANDGLLANSAPVKGEINSVDDKVVTFVYEEIEKPVTPAEVDVTREVKRTITYIQKDNVDGTITETVLENQKNESTVTFTGKKVIDTANNTESYKDWISENSKFPKVDTPVKEGYIANIASVEEETATTPTSTGEVTNITKTVVYEKLGSWIPKKPGEKTPTPIPYPNDPDDATKPKSPTYPETPDTQPGTPEKLKTPVIPYVEGYTAKSLKDPTMPNDPDHPEKNPLIPLTFLDPTDPTKGYKVPELPNDPKKDTVIEYKPNPQKILIKVVNVTTGEEVELPNEKLEFNGVSDQLVTSEDKGKVDKKIESLKQRGYIVSTKNPITETTKYDTKDDSNQKEPTQTYKIVVNEPVTKDTEVRKVTRTIKYVKIDVQDNQEVTTELNTDSIKKREDKVEFSRDTTTSLATGLTKIGAWDTETKELSKVNTPVLNGYLASVASVENKSVSPDTESYEVTVVYRKIGSWVPKIPDGVTPPTGTDITPVPYPNDPDDPTKPKNPEYPETPGENETPGTPKKPTPPVIPYIPGYTPKIGEEPLKPVDPNNPQKGYKVPPVPTTPNDPKTNTPITYTADPQKVLVKVVKVEGEGEKKTETPLPKENVTIDGKTGDNIPNNSVTDKITDLEKRGYVIDNREEVLNYINTQFDKEKDSTDGDPSQTVTLKVHEKVVEVTEPKTPNDPVDPTKPEGPTWPTEGLKESNLKVEVTRTITYVKKETPEGTEEPSGVETKVDKILFKRTAMYNLVRKTVTYGDWIVSTDETHLSTSFSTVKTPVLTGYIADHKQVEAQDAPKPTDTGGVTNIEKKVVYTKLGSWIPNVPGGKTPTPIPYPNDPDDPTKPKNPEYPETPGGNETPGTPSDPNKPTPPVIPYVPGYTPKIGENPLEPVDPKHPEKGYKVPPVPETPNDPKKNTQIEYAADSQKAVIKFVVVGEDGKETELETSRITVTGKTGEKIPTENFNDTLKKLTGDPVNNGDYELVENPLKDGATFDKVKDEEGKDPSQIFTVKLRQIYVIPPTPRIVERPSGNTVEVGVPSKDADTLSITFTKRNSTETETIVTKKDKDGTWKIEKSPDGVTIDPTTGRVYIPSNQVQPKTWVNTQTKHKYKQSKIVSVMPNILDLPEFFVGTTVWMDENSTVLKPESEGIHTKEEIQGYESKFVGYEWKESVLEGNKVTHIFKKVSTPTPYTPGEPTPENPTPQPNPEHPNVPTPSPELPNQETPIPEPSPEPDTPVSPKLEVPTSETGRREELPNTGTEANASLAALGLLGALGGFGLLTRKKEED